MLFKNHIKRCRLAKCYKSENFKLSIFMMIPDEQLQAITRSLEAQGAMRLVGTAPPGHLERDLADGLQALG